MLSQTVVFAGELSNLLMSILGGLPYRAPDVNVTIAGEVKAHDAVEPYGQSTSASNFDYKASVDMSNVRDRFSAYYEMGRSLGDVYAVDFDNSVITGQFNVTVNFPKSISQSPTANCTYTALTMPEDSIFEISSVDIYSWQARYTVKVKDNIPLTVSVLKANLQTYLADFCLEVDDLTATSVNTSIYISMDGYVNVAEPDNTVYARINFYSNTSNAIVNYSSGGTCGDNLIWTLDDNGTLTISGEGDMEDYYYNPSPWRELNGLIKAVVVEEGVTSIGNSAFSGCYNLQNITIGNSVTNIGDHAFDTYSNLVSVTIGSGVKRIGNHNSYNPLQEVHIKDLASWCNIDFQGWNNLMNAEKVYFNDELFSGILKIPDGVTSIGDGVFCCCNSLTSIEIPNSVITVGNNAFDGCYNLTSVTMGNNIISIGKSAFACSNLVSVDIPDSVTSIGNSAFSSCDNLRNITIGNGVTNIGYSAFFNTAYYNDEDNWENDILYIGDYLIEASSSIAGDITIRENTKTISDRAFFNRTNLTSVTIPYGVTAIGWRAFSGCTCLTYVEIPESVISIGMGAFDGCDSLAPIEINVGDIRIAEFLRRLNANEITDFDEIRYVANELGSIIPIYYADSDYERNIIYAISGKNFTSFDEYQKALAEAVFISSINGAVDTWIARQNLEQYGTVVGLDLSKYSQLRYEKQNMAAEELRLRKTTNLAEMQSAFDAICDNLSIPTQTSSGSSGGGGNYNIDWVLYDNGLLKISGSGDMQDYYEDWYGNNRAPWYDLRDSIETIVIEDGITSIGMYAFSGCYNLKSVTFPDSMTSIGNYAFQNCNNLTSIEIPDGVTNIGLQAFQSCWNLASIAIPDSNINIGLNAFSGTAYYGNEDNWEDGIFYVGNHLISVRPDISGDVVIREGTKTIPDNAFQNCQNITSVTIPNSVVIIGGWVFSDCTNLTSIEIPDSVESIGDCAFMGCSNLETVIIGNGVKNFGISVFGGTAFQNNLFDDESNWEDDILYIGNYLISARPHISGDVTIRDNTRVIARNAFSWCENIVQVEIPNSVVSIGEMAFSDCHNLVSIEIPNSVTSIGENAFNNCYNLASVTIPDSITSIDRWVFNGCSRLTFIEIPNSVVSIGDGAFGGCTNLASIEIPDSVTSIGEGTFSGCNLTSVTIGSGIKSIGNQWSSIPLQEVHIKDLASWCNMNYQGWNNLLSAEKVYFNDELLSGSLKIPDGVTSIGDNIFACCWHIESVTITDGVTSIGYGAFRNCSILNSIEIPNSVTSIGWDAFMNCINLANVYYRGTQEEWIEILNNGQVNNGQDILPQETILVCNSRRITYTGAYEGTAYAENLTAAELPEEYGYNYQFWIDDEPWDGVVQGDMEIIVTKTPKMFAVSYNGDYMRVMKEEYLTNATLPQPSYGYTYHFTVDGEPWDGIVRGDTWVTVTRTINSYTITYSGDYSEMLEADYLTELPLPEPPYGYTYSFMADGERWDGVVAKDTEVIVTKTPIIYTVTYTGDYEGTEQVPYLSDLPLPEPPYGYIYRFSSDANSQDGIVLGNTEVVVTRFCDLTELDMENLEDVQKGQDSIYGKFYEKAFVPQITVSENATYRIYADADCMQEVGNNFILERYENTFYIKVTAESGRETIYKITVDRAISENFGTLSFVQAVKDTMILRLDKPIVGNPTVKILFGPEQDMLFMEREAEIGDDRQSLYISGLIEDEMYYFKALATYEDIITESSVVLASTAKFSDCYVLRMISPAGGFIDHENGAISGLRVMNSVDKIAVDVDVSYKATWDLYRTATSATTYENRELPLVAGRTKTAYIRVKAEDGTTKVYSISIYRQTKSEKPQISVSGGIATITSPDGKNIYYTLDGSTPSEKNGILYEMPFAVSKGTIIRAVAKQENKDEYSDATEFMVLGNDSVTVTPIDVYTEGGNLEFEFFAESAEPIYGVFMIGVYDAFGKMTKLLEADTLSGEYEKAITGSLPVTDNEYDTCKFMLWSSYHEMKPLANALLVEKN